jgi:pyrroloquinoline quinone biosynthesis protein B
VLVKILGSAAGGGFPQWNCRCHNCASVRSGQPGFSARTQSSIAVSSDGERWILVNASPDIRAQLQASPALWPKSGVRDNRIAAIILTDSQIDHTSGLLFLRESGTPLQVFGTAPVRADLESGFPILAMLSAYCDTAWHAVPLGGTFAVDGFDALRFTAHAVTSNAPPYSPHRDRPEPGHTIALTVEDLQTRRSLFYGPGIGELEPPLLDAMTSADCVLVEGTCWQADELIAAGISRKTSYDMGHLPLAGEGGIVEALQRLPEQTRKILIHINNTNPILDEASPERRRLAEAGIEVAHDDLDLAL